MDKSYVSRKNNYVHGATLNEELGKDGFGCFFYNKFLENGDSIFQIDGITGKTETYASVLKRSIRVALEMKRRGVKEDDVIVLCSENTMDCFIPILATQLLNAVVACLDPSQSVRDVVYLMNVVEPKMIFVQDTAFELIEMAEKEFLFTPKIVVIGNLNNVLSINTFLKPHPQEEYFKPAHKDYKKTAIILFSSGTTGLPKGICVSAQGMLTSVLASCKTGTTGTVAFHTTSFYWISALCATLPIILNKGRKIIFPSFEVDSFFNAVQDHKIDYAIIATCTAYDFNKENTSKYNLSSLKLISLVGSIIASGHMERCRNLLPNTVIISGYGLTEASGYAILFPPKEYQEAKKYPASCGVPLPGMTIKVVDPETEEVLGSNQPGELRIDSKYRFKEYYKKDSSEAFDQEGYMKTGDIGYYDNNNYFYICDRIKDMFKYKSWHIVPASVEGVILLHPAVKEAVVIGVPDATDGDLPMALVVLKKDFPNTDENDLINFTNERVLDRETLRGGLRIVDKFPKTPSGKIPRASIRNAILDGSL